MPYVHIYDRRVYIGPLLFNVYIRTVYRNNNNNYAVYNFAHRKVPALYRLLNQNSVHECTMLRFRHFAFMHVQAVQCFFRAAKSFMCF